ncbi:MAG TPA: carboxyl transferase domain-containing protein, partial [Clostridia bacterium]|nr:carboxyl transferase domain-containing protein [Clostridia bacterium]
MSTIQSLEQVLERKQAIRQGETAWAAKQQSGGKLTARARVEALLDPASFVELDCLVARDGLAEGVVTGYGTVDGRPVYIFSQDYTVKAGAVTRAHAAKIVKVLELARKCGAPVVGICDSAGARLEEGPGAMDAYATIFAHVARLSGVVPTIGLVLGPCVGAGAILPTLMDVTLSVPGLGQLMAVGPAVASEELGHAVDAEALGGAKAQAKQGGIHLLCSDEKMAFAKTRMLLGLLPDNNLEDAPLESPDDLNRKLGTANAAEAFSLIEGLLDTGSALPLSEAYAPNLLTVLGRMGGRSVGIVANHALELDGKLDAAACRKAARFVRLCDCFNLPVISLINTKGLAAVGPTGQAELLKAAGQLTYAYAEATCAKLAVVTGSAIGA